MKYTSVATTTKKFMKKLLFPILGVSIKRFEDRLREVLKSLDSIIKQQNKLSTQHQDLIRQQKELLSQQKELINQQKQELKFLQEQLQTARKRELDLLARAKENDRKVNAIKSQLNAMEIMLSTKNVGINSIQRTPRIIVSMTSYPARILFVPAAMERLMNQTLKPDKIILWLSEEQFPGREASLPSRLIEMKKRGLEIEWCHGDMKAYKKLLPALENYPNDLIITVDDDLIYDVDLIENLYEAYRMNPHCIIASRVHKMTYDEQGVLRPYQDWEKEIDYDLYTPKRDLFLTGGAGTLYPPEVFDNEIFDNKTIQELCPYADDIWINIMAAIHGTEIVCTGKNRRLRYISGSQEDRLYDINQTENDVQLERLIARYGKRIGWIEKRTEEI